MVRDVPEAAGVSLSEEARARAENMLAQAQAGIDLNALGDTPRLGMAVVGRLSQMYNLQVSLRQSAYGGVRAVLIVPRDIVTTGPAPGIAHGIGASAVPRGGKSEGMTPEEARAPQRKPRPAARPKPPTPAPAPVAQPRPVPMSAMEDDVPVVTEWTENGLPQRRSRGRAPLGSHNLPAQERQAAAEAAAAAGVPAKEEPEPGIWLEAFTKAANGVPLDPPAEADGPPTQQADGTHDNTWDKGDLK
ncbi:ATPase [Streptomyces spiroverticillatus]